MFPLPLSTWIYLVLAVTAVLGIGYGRYEHNNYIAYKTEVESLAKIQQAKNESIKKQQELATKGIEKEYNAKLALLRQYYANGVRQPSSGGVSSNGISTLPTDAITAYNVLAGQCAEATQQLVSLQDWFKEQAGIK
jgi:hypothetical protein